VLVFDLTPSWGSVALFGVGWIAGWVLLWRTRPLTDIALPEVFVRSAGPRRSVAVIIPARNEARVIGALVQSLVRQLQHGDELVVVDDHSTDATAEIARTAGARVIDAPDLPPGWAGKPHACLVGVMATTATTLVFLDADITPGPGLINRLAFAVSGSVANNVPIDQPEGLGADIVGGGEGRVATLVSMQPWHVPGSHAYEQLSWPFNIIGLMGSLKFTAFGRRVADSSPVAFGPVLACRREDYQRTGGHDHVSVRAALAEDLAMGRLFDRVDLFTGAPDTTFRMYPDGLRSLVQGWTKIIATGAAGVRVWFAVLVAAWIWSLAGGWLTSPWFYVASLSQVLIQSRKVGRFSPVSALLYPLGIAAFIVIFVRSAVLTVLRRQVTWKGRSVASR
jgi:4,4'-diaponeurosporenoate glycosyltransferase